MQAWGPSNALTSSNNPPSVVPVAQRSHKQRQHALCHAASCCKAAKLRWANAEGNPKRLVPGGGGKTNSAYQKPITSCKPQQKDEGQHMDSSSMLSMPCAATAMIAETDVATRRRLVSFCMPACKSTPQYKASGKSSRALTHTSLSRHAFASP